MKWGIRSDGSDGTERGRDGADEKEFIAGLFHKMEGAQSGKCDLNVH